MTGPVRASDVTVDAEALGKTDEQINQENVSRAVHARRARSEALRRTGVLDGSGSPDLATKLEARLKAREAKVMEKSKAKEAVRIMQERRRGGDAA
jgi:hypothetical protein